MKFPLALLFFIFQLAFFNTFSQGYGQCTYGKGVYGVGELCPPPFTNNTQHDSVTIVYANKKADKIKLTKNKTDSTNTSIEKNSIVFQTNLFIKPKGHQ